MLLKVQHVQNTEHSDRSHFEFCEKWTRKLGSFLCDLISTSQYKDVLHDKSVPVKPDSCIVSVQHKTGLLLVITSWYKLHKHIEFSFFLGCLPMTYCGIFS